MMKCCCNAFKVIVYGSSTEFQPIPSTEGGNDNEKNVVLSPLSAKSSVPQVASAQEEKIELVFRSKRTNVFSKGFDVSKDVKIREIPKTLRQASLIRKFVRYHCCINL